ncbi:hypothetical protein L7F22_050985 [Adiantum nelumboides]|nr:hypothetical protein [Adiantum nelumboides]
MEQNGAVGGGGRMGQRVGRLAVGSSSGVSSPAMEAATAGQSPLYYHSGGGGPIMGDLWALKGLFDDEKDSPAWTQLKLPGQAPAPRCGHSVTAGGHQLLVYGGHGTGGWLTRYDIYHSDCVILDRASVQWKRLSVTSDSPRPRAYHTITRVGNQFLLIGGYDGKSTFGDFWWLVSEDDPMARRALQSAQKSPDVLPTLLEKPSNLLAAPALASRETAAVEEGLLSPLVELRRQLGLSPVPITPEVSDFRAVDQQVEKQLVALGISLNQQGTFADRNTIVKSVREHWSVCDPKSIRLKELGPLLLDYQQLVASAHELWMGSDSKDVDAELQKINYRFFHLKNARQLRLEDIPHLLNEYKLLLQHNTVVVP